MERVKQSVPDVTDNRFKAGEARPSNAGRKKGTPNAVPKLIKDLIVQAGGIIGTPEPIFAPKMTRSGKIVMKDGEIVYTTVRIGWAKTGKDGLLGMLVWYGLNLPETFAQMLMRVLPTQVNISTNEEETVTSKYGNIDTSKMSLVELNAMFKEIIADTKPLPPRPKPKLVQFEAPPRMIEGDVIEVEDEEGD